MSLFKVREFWCTHSEDGEYFDQSSLITAVLNSDSDYIITGSQTGVLRILKPSCELTESNNIKGFSAADLLIEKKFDLPILQVGCGRLISGSQLIQLAVLHPRALAVYSLKSKEGITEHGTQNYLELLYQHDLQRSAANFVIGPFGGTKNRDFICVQSLDGMLSFFEQENSTFSCFIPDFLLPGPIDYVKKTDSFVTCNANWRIVTYKYKLLSEAGEKSESHIDSTFKINCDWSYNLGESVIDISVLDDFINKEEWIVVLGERNLFCLSFTGKVKFMKRLEYLPICFNTYILDDKIFSLVISETGTILIYQNTSLKWAAKLNFLPITVRRAFLRTIKGTLVLLSEDGRLECCYLGTEPTPFVAPPVSSKDIDFDKAEEELTRMNKIIKEYYRNGMKINRPNAANEIELNFHVDPNVLPCSFESNIKDIENLQMCNVLMDVSPKSTCEEVQIVIFVQRPLKVQPNVQFYQNLEERISFPCNVYIDEISEISSLEIGFIATVISNLGMSSASTKSTILPLKVALEVCQPQKESVHKITLNINHGPVPLATLFPEFVDDNLFSQSSNAIGFKNISGAGKVVTILLAKSSQRYRLQSDSFASLSTVIEAMIQRLKEHYSDKSDFNISFSSSLPANEVNLYINNHFRERQQVVQLKDDLAQLSGQFRIIQKRLVAKFKAKNPKPLTNLEFLLEDTYSEIMNVTEKLKLQNVELMRAQTELSCALNVVRNLILLLNIDKKLKELLDSTFCIAVRDTDTQGWEDVMDNNLCHLLATVLAKSDKDKLKATSSEKVKDVTKLEKHLTQVLERTLKLGKELGNQPTIESDQNFKSCDRPCHDLDWPMICRLKLTVEMYQTMSQVCQDCPNNETNCENLFCITLDNSNRGVIIANRQFPGPSIQVCHNDVLVIDVINKIPGQSVGIHWRGQPNHEAPFMDGVPMITQCPISSYTTFQYKFRASSPGTHFYHAYSDADRTNGLFGALIVRQANNVEPHKKLYDIDSKKHIVLISEWTEDLSIEGEDEENIPKAILINGKSPTTSGSSLAVFNVKRDKRYRFRIAYTGGVVGCPITVSVDNHLMKVIALDGNSIKPYEASSAELSKGERLDFVLKTNQESRVYYFRARSRCSENELEGIAAINYEGNSIEQAMETKLNLEKSSRIFATSICTDTFGKVCLGDVHSLSKMQPEIRKSAPDRQIYFGFDYRSKEVSSSEGGFKEMRSKVHRINNLTFTFPPSPLLTQPDDIPLNLMCNELNVPDKCTDQSICECVHLEHTALGSTTEIILIDQGGEQEEHIFHLHGYHFYVVGSNTFDKALSREEIKSLDVENKLVKRNLVNPVIKDTIRVPRFGVVVLRFIANNPGFWMLRDEQSRGWTRGMDVVLQVGAIGDVVSTPTNFPTCGSYIGPDFFLV